MKTTHIFRVHQVPNHDDQEDLFCDSKIVQPDKALHNNTIGITSDQEKLYKSLEDKQKTKNKKKYIFVRGYSKGNQQAFPKMQIRSNRFENLSHIKPYINQSVLKDKINKNSVQILKFPNLAIKDEKFIIDMNSSILENRQGKMQEMRSTKNQSVNFNTYYEFQQYINGIPGENLEEQINNHFSKNSFEIQKKNTIGGIIPAMKPPKHRHKRQQLNLLIDKYYEDSMKRIAQKKKKGTIKNGVVLSVKKQSLIQNITNKYIERRKEKEKERTRNNLKQQSKDSQKKQSMREMKQKKQISDLIFQRDRQKNKQISPQRKTSKTQNYFLSKKMDPTNVYENKIIMLKEFLLMLSISHRIYRPLDLKEPSSMSKLQKSELGKYLYYVGCGNNSNLIRGLMKRKHWWVETTNNSEAHFVWTQLKLLSFYQTQNKATDIECSQAEQDGAQCIVIKKQKENPVHEKVEVKGCSFKAPFPTQPLSKLLTETQQKVYQKYFEGYENYQTVKEQHRLKYLPPGFLQITDKNPENLRVHNHFEFNTLIGNKKSLFFNLLFLYQLMEKDVGRIIPPTFHIKNCNDKQFQEFVKMYKNIQAQKNQSGLKNLWILKPGEVTNRGNGIKVMKNIRQIMEQIQKKQKHKNGQLKTFIVQKYIQKPLLYKNRKFDIRHYMLVSRLHGQMKGYWFGQGYARTSSYEFNLMETDPKIHLTNDAIQKYCEGYGNFQEGNKVSYNDLQKYFTKKCPQKNFNINQIYSQMKSIAQESIKSVYLSLDKNNLEHNFQIFGLDFMVDDSLKVYLIEVNSNPCLQLSSPLLQRIIPNMLDQAMRLTLDFLFPPNLHYTNNHKFLAPDCSLSKLQYQLIFDQRRDGKEITKLYNSRWAQYQELLNSLQDQDEEEPAYEDEDKDVQIDELLA